MSFTLELRGKTVGSWQLTTSCLGQIENLRATASRRAVELLFGDDKTEDGVLRSVSKGDLLDGAKEIAREARKMPGGFQMRIPPVVPGMKTTIGSGGVGGVLIEGRYYAIDCVGDHWTLSELREGVPEPPPRYDTAEIATENFGTIKVEPRKSSRSDLSRLAHNVQKFLESDPSDEIQIIWG
jgi:hypothetical protein